MTSEMKYAVYFAAPESNLKNSIGVGEDEIGDEQANRKEVTGQNREWERGI